MAQCLSDMAETSSGGRTLNGGTVLCMLAFVLVGCARGLQNSIVYPTVADYYGTARELSNIMIGTLYLLSFLIAARKPSLIDPKTMTVAALGCAITSCFVLEVALPDESALLTVLGLFFYDALRTWADILALTACASLVTTRSILVSVVCGIALGEIACFVHPDVTYQIAIVEMLGLHALVILLLHKRSSKVLGEIVQSEPVANMEISNPESFLKPTHPFFGCVLLFSIANGYGLTLNEVDNAPQSSIIQIVILVCVALWIILYRREGWEDLLFSFSMLLTVAGFALVPLTIESDSIAVNILIRVGQKSFNMLMWMTLLAVGRRNLFALLPSFSLALGIQAFGIDVGAVLGHAANDLAGTDSILAIAIANVVLFAFVAFLWLGFRRFSFSDTIKGVMRIEVVADQGAATAGETTKAPASPAKLDNAAAAPDLQPTNPADAETSTDLRSDNPDRSPAEAPNPMDERIRALSEQHGLTERESEIFALLAHGRNVQFVMDQFVISRNTVKTHVKHIYAKLDVHSQQELIDLAMGIKKDPEPQQVDAGQQAERPGS